MPLNPPITDWRGRRVWLIGASSGIGHMITDSQALLATDQIIFGIIVIGLIGLVSDLLFKTVNRRLFPWAALGK